MPIPSGSSIKLRNQDAEWHFMWIGFDLDDCFDSFRITIIQGTAEERYELGPCVVWELRRITRFFESKTLEDDVGGGFRSPDPRYYEVHRRGGHYELMLRFEGLGLQKQFALQDPQVVLDRKFLDAYEGREA
jgi:hypothetical protein